MGRPLVTHVLWTLGRAGAERVVLDLTSRLPDCGYEVRVVAAGGGGEMAADFRAAGISLAICPETRERRQMLAFLRREFSDHRPQILHTHLGADIWAGYLAWRLKLRPWICTLHNDDRDDRWSVHQARGLMYRRANGLAAVSQVVKDYAIREFRVKPGRVEIIRNGIDFGRLRERGGAPFHDVPRFITVGRLSLQKDQATLLRGLALVKRPWQLEVCGTGPLKDELERLAGSLGIWPRVSFQGSVSDIPERLAQADVFCFPSRWEGQGLALLEAAGSGLPVIASDLPVFRETFDEQSLEFAPARTPEAWAEAVNYVLDDQRAALLRAARAQAIVRDQFSVQEMVKRYAELYRSYENPPRQ
jgi:glycosyltransferase involved in cell wall biosynthesis